MSDQGIDDLVDSEAESDMDGIEEEEENNNVDNEDDDDHDDDATNPGSVPFRASTPFPQDQDNFAGGDVDNEIVVDNDEDNRVEVGLNISRGGDVEIVGEDIAVEIVAETAVIPDTEDSDTDIAEPDDETYSLPVITPATTEEVLGISSDSENGGTVEAADDAIEVGSEAVPSVPPRLSPQPGPSGLQQQQQNQQQVSSIMQQSSNSNSSSGGGQLVVRRSGGKRLPWRGNDSDSDTEDEDVTSVHTPPASSSTTAAGSTARVIMTQDPGSRNHDFNQRRFWRQLSSTNEDLGSIEPGCPFTTPSSHEAVRVRPLSNLQPSAGNTSNNDISLTPASNVLGHSSYTPSLTSIFPRPSSSISGFPNTTIRRISPGILSVTPGVSWRGVLEESSTGTVPSTTVAANQSPGPSRDHPRDPRLPARPASRSSRFYRIRSPSPSPPPARVRLRSPPPVIERVASPDSPVSPPQSTIYSPVQLPVQIPPVNTPRFEPNIPNMRDRARDLERIDRILELSRRTR